LTRLTDNAPAVVVNTVGPFNDTAPAVARACPPGTHYVDIGNELPATQAILSLDQHAAAAGQVLVTGAGFGVLATESVVLRLCAGQPRPTQVRVDSMAWIDFDNYGVLGDAFAATVIEGLKYGGREVRRGRMVTSLLAAHREQITTPDGATLTTAAGAFGDLLAAWRATDADSVVAAFESMPTTPGVQYVLPTLRAVLRMHFIADRATDRLARMTLRPKDRRERSSWAHARLQWPSGQIRQGWLRTGEGHDFTAAVAADVTQRLLAGSGRPGAHTPGALFGPALAESAGAELIIDSEHPTSSATSSGTPDRTRN
jgi:short subunit dehydrogenase-like uncharacterized protein